MIHFIHVLSVIIWFGTVKNKTIHRSELDITIKFFVVEFGEGSYFPFWKIITFHSMMNWRIFRCHSCCSSGRSWLKSALAENREPTDYYETLSKSKKLYKHFWFRIYQFELTINVTFIFRNVSKEADTRSTKCADELTRTTRIQSILNVLFQVHEYDKVEIHLR